MEHILNLVLRRDHVEPEFPICPDHKGEMSLRGKQGRPTRFSDQSEEEYTLIYYCPVDRCNHTAQKKRVSTQIPVPGETPDRPAFSRRE